MYLNMCWTNHPMTARTQNASQHVLTKPIPCQRGHKMYLNCIDQTTPMAQNVSQYVLTKPLQYQRWLKMYFKMCRPNASHPSEDTNCIYTCDDHTHHKPARTQKVSEQVLTPRMPTRTQHELIKPIACQRRLKTYLNMCWPNPSHTGEDTKYIPTCADQTLPMPARTQNAS